MGVQKLGSQFLLQTGSINKYRFMIQLSSFRNIFLFILPFLILFGCEEEQNQPKERETMYVEGRHIYSAAGERVVLRGELCWAGVLKLF